MRLNIKNSLASLYEALLADPGEMQFVLENYFVKELPSPGISLEITANGDIDFKEILDAGHIFHLHKLLVDLSNDLMYEIELQADMVFEDLHTIKHSKVDIENTSEFYRMEYRFEGHDEGNIYVGVKIKVTVFPDKINITYDIDFGSDKNVVESIINIYTGAIMMFFANRQIYLLSLKRMIYSYLGVPELPLNRDKILTKNLLIFLAREYSLMILFDESIEVMAQEFIESEEFADFEDNIESIVPEKLKSLKYDEEDIYFEVSSDELLEVLENEPEAIEKLLKLFNEDIDVLSVAEEDIFDDDIIELEEEDDFADWREIEDDEYLDDSDEDYYDEDFEI